MVSVVVFEFSGIRCQPLRRALCAKYWVHIHALMKNS
ncbi:acetyltransferase, partial [Vibrio cholerae]